MKNIKNKVLSFALTLVIALGVFVGLNYNKKSNSAYAFDDLETAESLMQKMGEQKFVCSHGESLKYEVYDQENVITFYNYPDEEVETRMTDITLTGECSPYTLSSTDNQERKIELRLTVEGDRITKIEVTDNTTNSYIVKGNYYPVFYTDADYSNISVTDTEKTYKFTVTSSNEATIDCIGSVSDDSDDIEIPRFINYGEICYSITKIEENAFLGKSISTIRIPETISSIGDRAFFNCSSLSSVKIFAKNPPTLGSNAFGGCNIEEIVILENSLASYSGATNWSDYTSQLKNTIKEVSFESQYKWNDGEDIIYGNIVEEIIPKVLVDGVEVSVESFTFTYFEPLLSGGWKQLVSKPKNIGEYKVVVCVNDDNYAGQKDFEYEILKRALNVHIENKASIVGEELAELTATCDNLAYDDQASSIFRLETDATKESPLGKYYIWGVENNGLLARNYDIYFEGTYIYDEGTPAEFNSGMSIYSINKKAEEVVIKDKNGNVVEEPQVMIIGAEKGIDPDAIFVVEVVEMEQVEDVEESKRILENENKIASNEKIYGIYDAKLLIDNMEVQPDGTLTIKMKIPEELLGKEFILYHIHKNGDETEVLTINHSNVDEDGCIIFETDKLSQFAFVSEDPSLKGINVGLIIAICLGSLLLLLIVVYVLGYFFCYRKGKFEGKKIEAIYKFLPKENKKK